MRIGVVPYINALPLCSYLSSPLRYEIPANLEKLMAEGELDVALLPIFALFKPNNYTPLFEAGVIQADGPVESVMIFYKDIHPSKAKEIFITSHSVTSVSLFKVIYSLFWKQDLAQLKITKNENCEVQLLIGDEALFFNKPGYQKVDLAQEWKKYTGLPFVFAAWVSQKNMAKTAFPLLKEARLKGTKEIDQIIKNHADLDPVILRRYLTKSIQYEATLQSLKAIEQFKDYCYQVGL